MNRLGFFSIQDVIAFSLMTVTVASATFSNTGIQSSRADDVIRLSTALLRMSMPEKTRCFSISTHKLKLLFICFEHVRTCL